MNLFLGLFIVILSFSAVAFDRVTDALPSGKIIICKTEDQVRVGNVVENYKLKNPFNRFDKTKIKINEFKLPSVGDRVKIVRSENIRKSKFESSFVNKDIGEAVIVEPVLTNELRTQITYPGAGIHIEKQIAFTESEIERVKSECIVASPVGSEKFKNLDIVKF